MTFSDINYFFIFLPVILALYYLSNERFRPFVLLFGSLLFYSFGAFDFLGILILMTSANVILGYAIGCCNAKPIKKLLFVVGVFANLAIFGYFKYRMFVLKLVGVDLSEIRLDSITLPLGISFFTFKAISYLADVYRNKSTGRNIVSAANYLTFFGQIQSGPISRVESFESIEHEEENLRPLKSQGLGRFRGYRTADGCCRFMIGFSKKILLADTLNHVTTEIFADSVTLNAPLAWLGSVAFSLQLFYDFSGYSDMAIGISKMFGLECPENFNYPYCTTSIREFWRRWHITLGAWFRDYVYIPLGGSCVGKGRLVLNLLAVWFLTGLWHGTAWGFVVWGMAYFILITAERFLDLPGRLKSSLSRVLYRIFSLLMINFLWVLFKTEGIRKGIAFIYSMLLGGISGIATKRALFLLNDYKVFFLAAVIFSMPTLPWLAKKTESNKACHIAFNALYGMGTLLVFLIALSMVFAGQNNPFVYANF